MMYQTHNNKRGVTLIEILVSFTIFVFVITAVLGSLLSVVSANRKAQATKSVINNLDTAIETMLRSIRTGDTYRCDDPGNINPSADIDVPNDCSGGKQAIVFESSEGDRTDKNDQFAYRLNGTAIQRSTNGGTTWSALTAPEVIIDNVTFVVRDVDRTTSGSSPGNIRQPSVVIFISGTAGAGEEITQFDIQTTAVQRIIDI